MDDGVDLLLGQCALQECSVSHIAFNRCDRRAQDLLKPLQALHTDTEIAKSMFLMVFVISRLVCYTGLFCTILGGGY